MKRSWKVPSLLFLLIVPVASAFAGDKLPGILSLLLRGGEAPTPPPTPGTVESAGRVWLDRNLGAAQVATSMTDEDAYGDLYQWGRGTDGHEKRNSGTTGILSDTDTPGHGNFITTISNPHDWRSTQNANLWQDVSGTNNPCPAGFRLPTAEEWEIERASWGGNSNYMGAYNSPLKLVPAGFRGNNGGTLFSVGNFGLYWSATVNSGMSRNVVFYSSGADMSSNDRANGFSVRCLKD